MKYTKILSVALVAVIIALGFLAVLQTPQKEENVFITHNAQGAVNSTKMQEGIEEAIEDYVPLIVVLSLLGIALSAIGINMARKYR